MKKILLLSLMFLIPISVYAKVPQYHKYYEKDYQKYWCRTNNGFIEYRLPDKTRVDCVTETHAIEFDFATKWAEAIGQSLYYANVLNKIPGIVLISEKGEKDIKYIKRVNTIAEKFGITVWITTPKDLECE